MDILIKKGENKREKYGIPTLQKLKAWDYNCKSTADTSKV